MDGIDDFPFRNRFAATDDAAITGILGDEGFLVSFSHHAEAGLSRTAFLIVRLGCRTGFSDDAVDEIFGDSRSRSQARRLDAGSLDEAFRLFRRAEDEVARAGYGADTGKFRNGSAYRDVRDQTAGFVQDVVHARNGDGRVVFFFIRHILGVRADEDVAMCRRADQDAFAHFRRCRENRRVNEVFLSRFIKEDVFAAARMDLKGIVPGKAADFVGMDAGGIDDVFRFDSTLVRFDGFDGTVFYGNARDLTFTDDFSAVDDGIFSKSQGQAERPADTGSRSPECAFDVLADIRFFFAHFVAADDFQSRNAIGIAPFEEFLEDVHLFIVESGYIRAGPADVQIQFVFQFMIHRIACNIHAGLHTTRRRIETCVKDGTVGLCRAGSQFRFLFNQDCTKIVLCQFVQNGCAGNTAANYDDICLFCHVHNLFLCKYQVSLSLMPLLYKLVKIIARAFLHIFTFLTYTFFSWKNVEILPSINYEIMFKIYKQIYKLK